MKNKEKKSTIQFKLKKPHGCKGKNRQNNHEISEIIKCADSYRKSPPLLAKYFFLSPRLGILKNHIIFQQ